MRLGVHIRIAGGLVKSLDTAPELGCEAVQLFSSNPNAWVRTQLDLETAEAFAARAAALDIRPIILHTPYLLNLAAPDNDIWRKSKYALADAVRRAPLLSAGVVVTHIGSHKGAGYEFGVGRIAEAVAFALGAHKEPIIALELGSGAGHSIGSRFAEIADIMTALGGAASRVGVALDTAHLWAAGYDVSDADGVEATFAELDRCVGADKLKVVHLNDTQVALGSHRDRHYHIGRGRIGLEGFRAVVNHPVTRDLPGIIETPAGDGLTLDKQNLDALRALRERA